MEVTDEARPRRGRLDRDTVLRAALRLVDELGVERLTMRRVATDLGVDPMSLYRHVDNKDALLDGIVEQLWSQVPIPGDDAAAERSADWKGVLEQLGSGLREVVISHPYAAPLLLSRPVMPRSALEFLKRALDVVQAAGFEERRAAAIVRCVSSVALSDAALQVSFGEVLRDERRGGDGSGGGGRGDADHAHHDQERGDPVGASGPGSRGEPGPDQWISIAQLLPPDTPAELVRVAWAVCPPTEFGGDFDLALELILAGAERLRERD